MRKSTASLLFRRRLLSSPSALPLLARRGYISFTSAAAGGDENAAHDGATYRDEGSSPMNTDRGSGEARQQDGDQHYLAEVDNPSGSSRDSDEGKHVFEFRHFLGTGSFTLAASPPPHHRACGADVDDGDGNDDVVVAMCTVSNRALRRPPDAEESSTSISLQTVADPSCSSSSKHQRDDEKSGNGGGEEQQTGRSSSSAGGGPRRRRVGGVQLRSAVSGRRVRRVESPLLDGGEGPDSLPTLFKVLVARSHGTSLCMEASCSCLAGALSVDGVAFFDDPDVVMGAATNGKVSGGGGSGDSSATVIDKHMRTYQGPRLNQRHLAEAVVSMRGSLNPLVTYRQADTNYTRHYVNAEMSSYERYGHCPVHTVSPALYSALCGFLADRGVDDDLALEVDRCARRVQQEEDEAWQRAVMPSIVKGWRGCS